MDELKNNLQNVISELSQLQDDSDPEIAHQNADAALEYTVQILGAALGISELTDKIIDEYDLVDKWYA